ncbi:unnamed protein product [Cochlearia groenlandica]
MILFETPFHIHWLPRWRSGPQAFAFDYKGKGLIYTGVSGGLILKYIPTANRYIDFAYITVNSRSSLCKGTTNMEECGRPAGMAFNNKTGELYVADAYLGLHVIPRDGGFAKKIAPNVDDGEPFWFLHGLDVDLTTGLVYFTSSSSIFSPRDMMEAVESKDKTGKLLKYDPSTKVVSVLMEGLSGAAGCAVSLDGSFVLVTEYTKSNIKRYWIKGPKAGSYDQQEDFMMMMTNSVVSNPINIKRIGSTQNFWVASVVNTANGPTDPSAVKISSDGKVMQTISLKDKFGDTLVSEINEYKGTLYIGTMFGNFVGSLKL